MQGNFIFHLDSGIFIAPNTVTDEGEEAYLKMLFQADNTIVAGGGNFYIGLCDQVPVEADTLTTIITEPSAAGGYARKAVTRDSLGWPTIDTVNGRKRILSALQTFTASGADFDTAFSRAFLCNVASGTSGILFALSGALSSPISLLDGNSFQMQYEIFLD